MAYVTPSINDGFEFPQETWSALPKLPLMTGSTILNIGCRRFFAHSPTTVLKIGVEDGEDIMTAVAHSILGACVPRVIRVVNVQTSPAVKSELCGLLLRMRARRFDYYGRPCRQPYIIDSAEDLGPATHACCMSRSEWDESRTRALQVSRWRSHSSETNGANGWDRPVLTHGDLSDRNILVDPDTLAITGFIDWETAGLLPAYFEYVAARLSSGHQPEWRVELLDVLRLVLRRECEGDAECVAGYGHVGSDVEAGKMYKRTIAA
ncbi:hypothetical protein K466DRAFT_576349 [Polyporus arcularius HHB13444]|uniref:Aminoglycoside phosphotransferase domain-containing protein n=1 Tax=Polyporus arcularius HHB13444 TaxID=1314778 RepID=A0A5C3PKI0_9APHY|nr:hypothetical protein K466DRAFT_576349 [Polyporus arcularius HHB13444]